MGDGVLIEFGSPVEAVRCAIELQEGMATVNSGVPEDRRIVLRIGLNLGDVVVENGDCYGDGARGYLRFSLRCYARLVSIHRPA
jgi:adenylate cyclase